MSAGKEGNKYAAKTDLAHDTRPETIELAEKEYQAVALRKQGWSYDRIAAELGYANRGGAHKAVTRALQRWMREGDDELRSLELERLDSITEKLWSVIEGSNTNAALRAVEQYMRVSERRAKLAGLDAPTKTQSQHHVVGDIRIEVTDQVIEYLDLVDAVVAEEITKVQSMALGTGDEEREEENR